MFEVKARLEAAGFQPRIESWSDTLRVTIEKDQLTAIYGVVGRFDGKNAVKDIEESRKRLVRVTVWFLSRWGERCREWWRESPGSPRPCSGAG
jgi:hypothetical protein